MKYTPPHKIVNVASGISEHGIIVGNVFDKYNSRNPVIRWMMKGFENNLSELVKKSAPTKIHEVGCGEGYWVLHWNKCGFFAWGSDFSEKAINLAKYNAECAGMSHSIFSIRNIYDLQYHEDSADLIVCCEVLEHLEFPEKALNVLCSITEKYAIYSVPNEPIWRILNMARGKYWSDFGNTPGHIQHWTTRSFMQLVNAYYNIIEVRHPFPWIMMLVQRK